MKHGPVLSAWRNADEVTIKPSQANASSTWGSGGNRTREWWLDAHRAISLGKRRVKVRARRRYPHRVRTPPGYEVLNSPANIRRIDCTGLSEMLACWLRNGLPTKTAYRNQRVSENRRLVDVRGVMVLGVAGITEPVEITLDELDLSTIVRAARDSKAEKIRDVSQLTTGLSRVRGAGGRRKGIQS